MSATELHTHLHGLQAERALALLSGLSADSAYMADLENEISGTAAALTGLAVTELAVLRAGLDGARPQG